MPPRGPLMDVGVRPPGCWLNPKPRLPTRIVVVLYRREANLDAPPRTHPSPSPGYLSTEAALVQFFSPFSFYCFYFSKNKSVFVLVLVLPVIVIITRMKPNTKDDEVFVSALPQEFVCAPALPRSDGRCM